MQLELPDSPNVVTRREKTKTRGRLFSLNKRESYATMIVEESMERISEEDDMRAMAAARVRRSSLDGGSSGDERRKSLSPPPSSSSEDGAAGLVTVNEEEREVGGRRGEEGTDAGQQRNVSWLVAGALAKAYYQPSKPLTQQAGRSYWSLSHSSFNLVLCLVGVKQEVGRGSDHKSSNGCQEEVGSQKW